MQLHLCHMSEHAWHSRSSCRDLKTRYLLGTHEFARSSSRACQGLIWDAVCFCSPEVPELSLLSEELTRSNNLSNFVRGLRAAFVASVL